MDTIKFYLTREDRNFNGREITPEEAEFIIFGVPYDSTSTYRTGSRHAPDAIRKASINIETYSLRTRMDAYNLKIHDAGNLIPQKSIDKTINATAEIIREIIQEEKIPIMMGGEHTITLSAAKAAEDIAMIILDAHMDLRDEYPQGIKISHATVTRRISEKLSPEKIALIGVRAFSEEELEETEKMGIKYKTAYELQRGNIKREIEKITEKITDKKYWLSIDMDILDPSAAPAVANPEPEGLSTHQTLEIIQTLINENIIGFDLVEVTPIYDRGVTAITAAKIILETACLIKKAKP